MRVLGLCRIEERGALPHLRAGPLALLTTEAPARARLGLCLRAHAALPAFLPFAVRSAPEPEAALSWAAARSSLLLDIVERLREHSEMILTLSPPHGPPAPPTDGLSYLQARLRSIETQRRLDACLADLAPRALPLPGDSHAVRAESVLLLPTAEVTAKARQLAAVCPSELRLSLRLSGPWPAFIHGARFCNAAGQVSGAPCAAEPA
ncbi:hypothetical protein CLG85_025215 [Yangia mangrovi]|uniref:Gas vesicle synthesis protein GvpL/GvpF n=1 Tax=Alloyangia mangrovi TaxID=1779329 RepID=A0ABT2KT02_9RHOB|nr:hypothetical protein [Alloyangia mangrovi]MCT4373415.1 hypothetical protein [Alloyangia mangrovi]